MNSTECQICKSSVDAAYPACPRCGDFSISDEASKLWNAKNPSHRQITNACGWIREHRGIALDVSDVDFLLSVKTPSVSERAIKILISISHISKEISYKFNLNTYDATDWLGISYSEKPEEIYYLFKTFLNETVGYISYARAKSSSFDEIQITPKGHEFLESLKSSQSSSQIGFCAMWFDMKVLRIWTNAIEPAIKDAGYNPQRIDRHQHNNRIDDEIIAMLRNSKFVVADFTGQRGGVYFEAGFALGLGLQVIWTCKKSDLKKVHFDTRQYNFVVWEEDKLDDFQAALKNRIEATIGRGKFS